jgi:LPS sulfotransferase NodH
VSKSKGDSETIAAAQPGEEGASAALKEERHRAAVLRREEAVRARALKLEAQEEVWRARAARAPRLDTELGPENPPDSIEMLEQEVADASFARPNDVLDRLKTFPDDQVLGVRRRLRGIGIGPWPKIEGCLAVLFTSRSGSTFLARELERAFQVGRLREALRPHLVSGRRPVEVVKSGENEWFSFKAGGPSVIAAELCGFFDAFLSRTSFLLLLRKDIIAQAVSGVKARQTGQWHSRNGPNASPSYDHAQIASYILVISNGVAKLRAYARLIDRPCRVILYEDFADGDFNTVEKACDAFGIPRREPGSRVFANPLERIGDATNEAWAVRFREEMDASVRDCVEQYLLTLPSRPISPSARHADGASDHLAGLRRDPGVRPP